MTYKVFLFFVVVIISLNACNGSGVPLVREEVLVYEPVSKGIVISRARFNIDDGVTNSERVFDSVIKSDLILGVILANSAGNDGKSYAYKYTLDIGSDQNLEVVSLSIVKIGDFVEVIDINNPDYYIVKKLKLQASSKERKLK
tara:strand:+ start:607 stop:1035 length:429 start_codon:yes stop_codon:yes gene_type:complete